MDLAHLKAFYEVGRWGSFSKAAEVLFTSQPALSRQVAALEKELGLDLFSRQPRGVILTEAGRRLFAYAEQIFSLLAEAARVLAEFKNLETGTLALGASTTIGNYLLPPVLAAYRHKHPGVEVCLQIGNSQEIEAMVADHRVEIGLLAGPLTTSGLYVEVLLADELVAVVAPDHPLAQQEHPPLTVLARETLLLREPGSATRRATEEYLAARGIVPGKTFVLGNTEAIKRAAASGLGIPFLSRYTMDLEFQYGRLLPLNGPEWRIERPLFLAFPKDTRLSPPALAFLAHIRKQGCLTYT
ncbi:LysR substrate-binding domain-containing protein [Moorella naiadis]|uniref:LysR substrate-binding domain-containing protein n=1 Tax=Moorella naiadis (nom. illeg.) TaxID=3093670 RepID=UPI003D9CA63F